MTSFRINPVGGLWLAAVVALVLVGLLFVGPGRRRTTRRQRALLMALRAIPAAMLIVAFLRPAIVYTDIRTQSASLSLVIDVSRSLSVSDALGGKRRWDALRERLDAAAGRLESLGKDFNVHAYGFARDVTPLAVSAGKVALPETPDGTQTAIGAALEDVMEREAAGRTIAVLLLSDGAQRAYAPRDLPPQQPARQLRDQGIPLYTFVFGGSGGETADLAVSELLLPEVVFAEMPVEIGGELRIRGYGSQELKVQLLWETAPGEMTAVDTLNVRADLGADGLGRLPLAFRYTPATAGEYKVAVRAEPQEGERVVANNMLSSFVRVQTGGVKILLLDGGAFVGGGPLPEQRGVRWALATSPDFALERQHFDYRHVEIDGREYFSPGTFDVLLLLNVDAHAMSGETWQAAAEWVDRGGGLMMAGGEHSFGAGDYRRTALFELLPIEIGRAEKQNFGEPTRTDIHLAGEIGIRPTRVGRAHWIMDLGSGPEARRSWDEVAPLDGANIFPPSQIKPGATVLAESADDRRMPLLVAGRWGNGRVLAFAGDSTEKWRRYGQGEILKRFWRQAVLWLAKKDVAGEGEVWIRLARRRMLPGETMTFTAGARSAQGQPIPDAELAAHLELPDGQTRRIELSRRGEELLGQINRVDAAGDYRLHVAGTASGETIGSAEARFLIEDQDLELDNPAADAELLAALARATADAGGESLPPEQLPDLLDQLADRKSELEVEYVREVTPWDTWPFFLVLVGMLSLEWYLRKRWGLV